MGTKLPFFPFDINVVQKQQDDFFYFDLLHYIFALILEDYPPGKIAIGTIDEETRLYAELPQENTLNAIFKEIKEGRKLLIFRKDKSTSVQLGCILFEDGNKIFMPNLKETRIIFKDFIPESKKKYVSMDKVLSRKFGGKL